MTKSRTECIANLKADADLNLTDIEAEQIVDDMLTRRNDLENTGRLGKGEADLAQATIEYFEAARLENANKRRQAAINVVRRAEMETFINESKAAGLTFMDAMEAKLVGNAKRMFGARGSIDANRAGIYNTFVNQFESGVRDIAQKNNLSVSAMYKLMAQDRDFQLEFVQSRLNPESATGGMAKDLAELYGRLSEEMRLRQNAAGADIGKLEGRLPQSHDVIKMMDKSIGTKEDWIFFVRDRLDLKRSYGMTSKVLGHTYDSILLGMERLKRKSDLPEAPARRTPRNITAGTDAHRVIHFKDAAAYMEYMERYGKRNLWESIMGEMDSAARNLAMMETLGPNPEHMIRNLIQGEKESVRLAVEMQQMLPEEGRKSLNALESAFTRGLSATGNIANWLAVLSGETLLPGHVGAAKAFGIIRSVQSMGKLGGATLSAVADLFTKAMSLRTNGMNFLEAHARAITDITRSISPENRRLLNDLGFYFELENGALIHRFDQADTIPGGMTALMNKFFKYSGLTAWTEKNKAGMAQWLSHTLGESHKLDYAGLNPDVRAMLDYHGISSDVWDVYRSHMTESFDGRRYMNPSLARNLTDSQIASLLPEHLQGKVRKGFTPQLWAEARQAEFDRIRTRLETQARAFYVDETKFAVIEPDAKTTATMNQGTRPGTIPGEALRMIMQFKSFPIAFWQRTVSGRRWIRGELQDGLRYGMNRESLFDAFTRDKAGFVNYMASSLAYGYIAMSLKDLAKNRTPKDPARLETWYAAALQSGGLGIYGDFFLGKANRFGNGFLETLAGPTMGEMSNVVRAIQDAMHGDIENSRDTLIRVGIGNIPFGNLWYTKAAADWLFFDDLKEWMSPGYKRRMLRNMREEYGQRQIIEF